MRSPADLRRYRADVHPEKESGSRTSTETIESSDAVPGMPFGYHTASGVQAFIGTDRAPGMDPYPPQILPVLRVMLGKERAARICAEVPRSLQVGGPFGLDRVYRNENAPAGDSEHDRNGVHSAVPMDRREDTVAG